MDILVHLLTWAWFSTFLVMMLLRLKSSWMHLVTKGEYTLAGADKDILDLLQLGFCWGWNSCWNQTCLWWKQVYRRSSYSLSCFTEACVQKTDDHTYSYRFLSSHINYVWLFQLSLSGAIGDDFRAVEDLHQLSGVAIPAAVDGLEHAEVRRKTVVAAADMQKSSWSYLGV